MAARCSPNRSRPSRRCSGDGARLDVEDLGAIGPTGEDARRRLIGMVERGTLKPGAEAGRRSGSWPCKLGVSRSTLRQALGSLEEAGIVRRVPGRGGGTFIAAPKVDRDLSRIVGIPMLLRDQGFTAGSRVLASPS